MSKQDKLKKAKRIIKQLRSGPFDCYCGLFYGITEKLKAEKKPDANGKCWYTHSRKCANIQQFLKSIK